MSDPPLDASAIGIAQAYFATKTAKKIFQHFLNFA